MIVTATISLGIIGAAGAALLYIVAKKFEVEKDPRLDLIIDALPSANCGGCGYAGCGGFAAACVDVDTLDGLLCPVGGTPVMEQIAGILGLSASDTAADPMIAVVQCGGESSVRAKTNIYDGVRQCSIASALYGGDTGCAFGCLGYGDCVQACAFGAITVDSQTGIAHVDEDRCTACGACVKACPKAIIQLRTKGLKNRRIIIPCSNIEKGALCRKVCERACIACGKCAKECRFEAISIVDNLARLDYTRCKLCRKCVDVCPQGIIREIYDKDVSNRRYSSAGE
jgi:Na+-translocating ferredoxin:NAD+ oxidoreductase RNF subunit RnfB